MKEHYEKVKEAERALLDAHEARRDAAVELADSALDPEGVDGEALRFYRAACSMHTIQSHAYMAALKSFGREEARQRALQQTEGAAING